MELYLLNKNNKKLDLLNNKNRFILKAADALHGIETDIKESESPYVDGAIVDNVKALPRGIELTFKLVGNVQQAIDLFTSTIKSKQYVTLVEKSNGREIAIKGVATIPPYSRMEKSCELVLSIYCPQPYWEDITAVVAVIDDIISMLCFPIEGQYFTAVGRPFGVIDTSLTRELINEGDVSIGALFSLTATGAVVNPRISCSTGEQNGWYMQFNITMADTDKLEISTIKGNKYIKLNGATTYNNNPLLSYLTFSGTDWLQVEQGSNTYSVTATSGEPNIYFNATYKRRYE